MHCLNVNEYDIHAPDTFATIDSYLRNTQMVRDRTWATENEIYAMAYLLRTSIFLFNDLADVVSIHAEGVLVIPLHGLKLVWQVF